MSCKTSFSSKQIELFAFSEPSAATKKMLDPTTYSGLAGFHKYWGKKPIESVSFLIEKLTDEGEVVLDPFLGSGLVAIEALSRGRKFIGIDINPFAIEHASFLLSLPRLQDYRDALRIIENEVAEEINNTYRLHDGRIASHYLWEDDKIVSIWIKPEGKRTRLEIEPTQGDKDSFLRYKFYNPKHFRNLIFFTNSRINVNPTMTLHDVFTGRALMNIDKIINVINRFPSPLKRALFLTLTSASGQMSNMVFAIKNRGGKRNGEKIEVGSWVIGYWIPKTHFEVNVWNCFKNRANKLLKVLPKTESSFRFSTDIDNNGMVFSKNAMLLKDDCRLALQRLPDKSISFVCTDPPHSDRIPYLELSEMWNSILGYQSDFENEIVVSNARERGKTKSVYNRDMTEFFYQIIRVLKDDGYVALFFNARDGKSWEYLKYIEEKTVVLKLVGCFPMVYSATSVVQDNRKGSMKNDYIIIYRKNTVCSPRSFPVDITTLPGWSNQLPEKRKEQL